ncbi:GNAT family N-acetyltransferase [Streptomyces bathyalis]|uniref:GNAT family N-acetyltransferase n=1 Tax=Streptomyces bathyalis TaxID=2710756 RepID=A0A7T1TCR4_9ACTN|nr:GNAT family N-acetyltransferase [Streptomyces bathyalis]QPP10520.1 GNAT family N-acetyltransferase [Streptomyces bathyalis]
MRGAPAEPAIGVTYEQDGPLVRAVGGFRAFVFGPRDSGLRGADLDRLIARQRDRFAAREETAEWRIHAHDEPRDLPERLRAAGFVPGDGKTVLVGASAELATEPPAPEGVVIRRVTDAGDMRRIAAVEASVWDMDLSWLARFLAERIAASPDGTAVLVAEAGEAGGQVVAAGWMIFQAGRGFAGLRGGTTLPEWRGRGVYRALVAERARIAAARRLPYLQVDASDDSLPILRRLGFRTVTTVTPYVWRPARG